MASAQSGLAAGMIPGLKPYPEMKDSGVPWLGDVPAHWEVSPLSKIASERREKNSGAFQLLSVFLNRGVIPHSRSAGQVHAPSLDLGDYSVVRPGDFVLNNQQAWRGSVGVSSHLGVVSPAYFVLRFRRAMNQPFSNFLVQSPSMVAQYVVASKGVGDIQRQLYWPYLRKISLPIPPQNEQVLIGRLLSSVDRLTRTYISAKQKLIKLLEEQKQAIIHKAVTRGLDADVRLKPSGVEWLGDIPEHWEVTRLKSLLRPLDTRSSTGTEPLLSLRREHGIVAYSEHFERPPQAATTIGYKLVSIGNLVVNRLQANNGLVFASSLSGLVSPDYSVLESTPNVDTRYLSALLRTSIYRWHFRRVATGLGTGSAGFLRVYDVDLLATPVPLPPLVEQQRILEEIASNMQDVEQALSRERSMLSLVQEYQTRMLSDVVTGKLDVREAAARLPETLPDALEPEDETEEEELEETEEQEEIEV